MVHGGKGSRMGMDRSMSRPATICVVAAAACVALLLIGVLATRFDDGLFVPIGASGTALSLVYWISALLWLGAALVALRRRTWVPVLASGAVVALTLTPSVLLAAACATGGCL